MKKVIFIATMLSVFVWAGQEKGGGEVEKLKFAIVANKVLSLIKSNKTMFPEVDLFKLAAAVNNTRIQLTNHELIVNGEKVTATNDPDKKIIEVSRFAWRSLNGQPTMQSTIVAHEYFGIIKLDDSNGHISHRVATVIGKLPVAFFRWSCSAFAGRSEYSWRFAVIGEGETAGEAWSELLDTANAGLPHGFNLMTSTSQDKNVPFHATIANACIKN